MPAGPGRRQSAGGSKDDVDAFIILKDGDRYLEFAIPVANVGGRVSKAHPAAIVRTAADYAAAPGPVYNA